jgi:hypothetical protein
MLAERQTFVTQELQRWADLHGEARFKDFVHNLQTDCDAELSS